MTASPAELGAIEDNLATLLGLFTGRPGSLTGHDPDAAWVITGIPAPPFNAVCRARFEGATADARIEALLGVFREHGHPMSWWVTPLSTPPDLVQRLLAHGLRAAEEVPGMSLSLASWQAPALPAGVSLERVADPAAWHLACEVMRLGYGLTPAVADAVEERLRDVILADPRAATYLARLDGQPVSTALGVLEGGVVGLYNVATIPAARGRGAGGAVTAAAVAWGRQRGATLAVLEASEMGAPVYRRLGFREACPVWILVGP